MTIKKCKNYCKDLGKTLAGLDTGFKCRCSNTWPNQSLERPEESCNMPCAGESGTAGKCGGASHLTIYSLN